MSLESGKEVTEVKQPRMFDNPLIRHQFIVYEQRFFPENRRELNEAFTLIGYQSEIGAAALHLNHIMLHQIKMSKREGSTITDPKKSVRRVASEYGRYFTDSKSEIEKHMSIRRRLYGLDGDTLLRNDKALVDFLPDIARIIDLFSLEAVLELPDPSEIHSFNGTDYRSEDDNVKNRMDIILERVKVSRARYLTKRAAENYTKRAVFWRNILKQSMDHMVARPIVGPILHEDNIATHARNIEDSEDYDASEQ